MKLGRETMESINHVVASCMLGKCSTLNYTLGPEIVCFKNKIYEHLIRLTKEKREKTEI
jgi:hypothetical protein